MADRIVQTVVKLHLEPKVEPTVRLLQTVGYQSPVTHGKAFNYAVTSTYVGTNEYVKSCCYAFVNHQTHRGTSHTWGTSHSTGLPTHAR